MAFDECTPYPCEYKYAKNSMQQLAAASLALIMLGAAWQLRGNGFFMNWFGNQKGEGLEFFLLAVGIAVALVITGAGKWSVDALLPR